MLRPRNLFVYLLVLVALVALFYTAFPPVGGEGQRAISLTELAADVKEGKIRRIQIREDRLRIEYVDHGVTESRQDPNAPFVRQLQELGVTPAHLDKVSVIFVDPPQFGGWAQLLVNLLPLILFAWILFRLAQVLRAMQVELRTLREELALQRSRQSTSGGRE